MSRRYRWYYFTLHWPLPKVRPCSNVLVKVASLEWERRECERDDNRVPSRTTSQKISTTSLVPNCCRALQDQSANTAKNANATCNSRDFCTVLQYRAWRFLLPILSIRLIRHHVNTPIHHFSILLVDFFNRINSPKVDCNTINILRGCKTFRNRSTTSWLAPRRITE